MKGLTLFLQAAAPRNYSAAITGASYSILCVLCAPYYSFYRERRNLNVCVCAILVRRFAHPKFVRDVFTRGLFAPNFDKSARSQAKSSSIRNRCDALSDLLSATNNRKPFFIPLGSHQSVARLEFHTHSLPFALGADAFRIPKILRTVPN